MNKNDLINELGTNFIEYAVAVNTDRSIPDARSGLKPVARRILWSAFESGHTFSKPHVKSARIVGDVMGKYHPHGDSSIYGAMTRLSQNWVMRYPLIDWHGNNGNIAGDGAAHMRYTEARLSKITEDGMLQGIKKKNVDFIPNYSEDAEEPTTLPAIFPNLLCNPNSGIGVAMACSWAPHNLREVAKCIEGYIDGKEFELPGPDFPTGGIIINKNDIPGIMKTGHGSVKVRGKYNIEKNKIIFYEIPYGTTIEGLVEEIGKVAEEDIKDITDIRDESNKKGIRIVIECDKNINPEGIVKKLFVKTKLQTSFSYNQVALIDKTPTELNLEDCLKIYLKHNIECLIKEIKFDLKKAGDRLEIVNGLLIALEDIDNIIAKIKASENAAAARETLMSEYKMTEAQAKAVLDMKLAKLAKLEKVEVQNEKLDLINKIQELNTLLNDENAQKIEIKNRLNEIVRKYGDDRRTELAQIEIQKEEKEIETVIPEDCVVIATQTGDIKRIPKASFKVQRRGGKGVKSKDGAILTAISTNTIDNLLIFTTAGKMYKLLVDNIPVGTNSARGISINSLINLDSTEQVVAITSLDRQTDAKYVVFIMKNGLIKKTALEEYKSIKRAAGVQAIKIAEGNSIAKVTFLKDEELILITKLGMAIRFKSSEISAVGRVAMGVKGITLKENDEVVAALPVHKTTDKIAIIDITGKGKKFNLDELTVQGRGGKGVIVSKVEVAGAAMVDDEDSLLLLGQTTNICVAATEIPLLGRISQGNIIGKGMNVVSIVKL